MRFATQMRLSSIQVKEARNAAKGYIIDQVLEAMFSFGGHDDYGRQELFKVAKNIGMSQQDALKAEAEFQRRRG